MVLERLFPSLALRNRMALRACGTAALTAVAFSFALAQFAQVIQNLSSGTTQMSLFAILFGTLVAVLLLSLWMLQSQYALRDALLADFGDDKDAADGASQGVVTASMIVSAALVLFTQSLVLFLLTVVLLLAFWQVLIRNEAAVVAATKEEGRAHAEVAAQLANLKSEKSSVVTYGPEAVQWARFDLRHALVQEAREANRAEAAMTALSLWGRSRWYGLVFLAVIVLPLYGQLPPIALTTVAFLMFLLDRLGTLWLTFARIAADQGIYT